MTVMTRPSKEEFLVFEDFTFTKFPALICLFGFSGCGKTLSAIKIARGMGGKTMFLDTETGRGRVYAEEAKGFGYTEMTPPFTPERYMAAIKQIEAAGFDNVIIDSGSHEWDGLGGMLEIADNKEIAAGRNIGLAKWSVKNRHKAFMNTMMAGRMNIIICLRAKDKFVQEGKGKDMEIYTDGFVAIQERNFKYDMMIQLPMPEDGQGRYLMDRTKGFKCPAALLGAFEADKQISFEVGVKIAEWINTGQPVNELTRQLKGEAMSHAEQGLEPFRAYWLTLPKDKKMVLTPYLANFESAARVADLETRPLVAGEELNKVGTDISALKHGLTPLQLATMPPKDKLTTAIETPAKPSPVAKYPPRKSEDSDWWAVVDEIEIAFRTAKRFQDLIATHSDYTQQIESLKVAPEAVKNYWNDMMAEVQNRFAGKAA